MHISNSTDLIKLSLNESIKTFDDDSNRLINNILFFITICVSIPSVFINLFALYQLHANTKLSVFVFRTILHVSLFTTCTCIPFFFI